MLNSTAVKAGCMLAMPALPQDEKIYSADQSHRRLCKKQKSKEWYRMMFARLDLLTPWMLSGSRVHARYEWGR